MNNKLTDEKIKIRINAIEERRSASRDFWDGDYEYPEDIELLALLELKELRRNYLALRGEIEDVRSQLYEAENQANEYASELQERRKVENTEPIYQCEFCHHDGNGELQWHWEDVNKDFYDQYDSERRGKRRILYTAPPVLLVTDGYIIVPIVPTEDMIINGFESVPDPHFSDEKEWEEYEALSGCRQAARRAELCWAAMIKAAPKQENI